MQFDDAMRLLQHPNHAEGLPRLRDQKLEDATVGRKYGVDGDLHIVFSLFFLFLSLKKKYRESVGTSEPGRVCPIRNRTGFLLPFSPVIGALS